MISIEQIKKLREETLVSINECKKALEEAGGDLEKAKEVLRKRGARLSEQRANKEGKEGIIEGYIHQNQKIGVLLEIKCETDFVAKSADFKSLAHDICLHVAGMGPKYIRPADIPEQILQKEKEIYIEQLKQQGKPANLIEKIIPSKLDKFKNEISLLTQPFVKDPDKTVQDLLNEAIAKLGEKIFVERFIRYET